MMRWAISGFFLGVVFTIMLANEMDDARVERGWMEQRGKIYVLIPAKVEAAR